MSVYRSPAQSGGDSYVRLLRLPQVISGTGQSRSSIYRAIAAGSFPTPVKLSERSSAWVESEIIAWCQARIAARDVKDGAR
ncbi:helix-turn-helix transcriptional regulator [Lysobacter sp. P5_B9]